MVYGNTPVDLPGAFFQPTILTDIDQDNPAYRTELFGPVACVYKVYSEDEAVELANDVPYGLGAQSLRVTLITLQKSQLGLKPAWLVLIKAKTIMLNCHSAV